MTTLWELYSDIVLKMHFSTDIKVAICQLEDFRRNIEANQNNFEYKKTQ